MAATNINKRLGEINARETEARKVYRETNGLKIAAGFKKTDIYKSLEADRAEVRKLRDKLKEYRQREEKAREQYRKRTGKKIAQGFKKSKEAKRIEANRKQVKYRAERRAAKREADRRKVLDNPVEKGGKDFSRAKHKANLKTNAKAAGFEKPRVLAAGEIYHHVLGYSDRLPRAIRDAFNKIKARADKQGRAVNVVVNYPDGGQGIYNSPVKVDQAFRGLYMMGLTKQHALNESDALFIDAVQTDGQKGYYFFVDGYYSTI